MRCHHTCPCEVCDKHKVFQLVTALCALCESFQHGKSHLLPDIIDQHDTLQSLTWRLGSKIASKIRPLKAGGAPWSPELQQRCNTIKFWTCMVKSLKGVIASCSQLCRLACRLGCLSALRSTLEDSCLALEKAKQVCCRKAKPQAQTWRKTHLQKLLGKIVKAEQPGCRTRKQALARICREELARSKGAACKRIRGRSARAAVLCVNVPGPSGMLVTLHTQEDMARAMAESNVRQQQQCQGTPSMSEPLSSDFGHLADTPSATAVLDGAHVPPPGTDPCLWEFLACLRRPESLRRLGLIMTTVTPDQTRHAWRTQEERKAAEPLGLSFSHCKAASTCPLLNGIDTLLWNPSPQPSP